MAGSPLRDALVGAAAIAVVAAADAVRKATRERAARRVMPQTHACDNCSKDVEPIAEHFDTDDDAGWTLKCPVCNHEFGTVKEWWYDERHI